MNKTINTMIYLCNIYFVNDTNTCMTHSVLRMATWFMTNLQYENGCNLLINEIHDENMMKVKRRLCLELELCDLFYGLVEHSTKRKTNSQNTWLIIDVVLWQVFVRVIWQMFFSWFRKYVTIWGILTFQFWLKACQIYYNKMIKFIQSKHKTTTKDNKVYNSHERTFSKCPN